MTTAVQSVLHNATRKADEPLNICSFSTHERYQTGLAKTGHNFYLWQGQGIKPWKSEYAPVPPGHVLLNPSKYNDQIPSHVDIDMVLSQNKFGQFQVASKISKQLQVPLISLEHTLPMESWNKARLTELRYMIGDINIFISEYSRDRWGWGENDAEVIHHGVDTDLFCVNDEVERSPVILSVVNDWINRDWCCGFNLWRQILGHSQTQLPVSVIGDTPGLSEPASSTQALVEAYQSSRIFLNTSLISPVPTSLLEAMSCGCAVVSTATCMIPEIIENGVNGFISNDPTQLYQYVVQLLNEPDLARDIGLAARSTIEHRFSLDSFVDSWNEVFQRCV